MKNSNDDLRTLAIVFGIGFGIAALIMLLEVCGC